MVMWLSRMLYYFVFYSYKVFRLSVTRLYQAEIKAKAAKCGYGVSIYYPFRVSGLSRTEFGNNVNINQGAYIRADGGLKFGSNILVGPNLMLYTINHNYEGDLLPYDDLEIEKPVVIEDNVWIGANVTIVPGVRIGEGAIIGAGTVVSSDVQPLAIVGSASVRVIKFRDQKHYYDLKARKRFGGINGKPFAEK